MIDIDRALHDLADRMEYPETPDLTDSVLRSITAEPTRTRRAAWRPTVVKVGAALAVVMLVVALIPAAREEVASWLGLRGVTIVDAPATTAPPAPTTALPPSTTFDLPPTTVGLPPTTVGLPPTTVGSGLGIGLDLGEQTTLEEAAALVGFEPLIPSALGQPDAVFADEGRLWMLYVPRPGLPETAAPGVGAIVTQFPFATAPGLTKSVIGGAAGGTFIEVAGEFGVWLEGPHELILPDLDGSGVQGRSAGNTLLWERGQLTLRLEVALPLSDAVEIAVSFE